MLRIVVDLGNSRVKWGRLGLSGDLDASMALPTDGSCGMGGCLGTLEPRGCRALDMGRRDGQPARGRSA